jgi:hypothetical protein
MIVKNESHVIKNTLENLCKYINFSYYVISDTGSTDNTIEIIKSFFDSINVKGEIYIDTWKDFGYNRSLSLKYAYKKTKYLMIFDADDTIHGEFTLPEIMEHDSYYLNMGCGVKYKRVLIVNNHLTWAFIGVLHEFIICNDKKEPSNLHIEGNYHIESGKTGSRSNDPEKYNKDALILEKAYYEAEKNNDHLKVRYSFYTAQSYRDANNKEKAIIWYKKRIDFKDWNQELYFSHYMIGILYRDLGEIEKALYYWALALDVDEERVECQYEIISHYRKLGLWRLAYNNFKMIENKYINVNLNDKLFTYYHIYNFLIDYELSIISYHVNKINEGIEHYKKLFLLGKNIGTDLQINVLENFLFYIDYVKFDIDLFENYCNFIKSIYSVTKGFVNKHTIQINRMVTKMTSYYNDKYTLNNISSKINCRKNVIEKSQKSDEKVFLSITTCKKYEVFLSITTCKRYDLFVKTINSFMTCCKDIDKIDYFFCIDDNSSEDDRKNMIEQYHYFEYYFKNESEKGHLNSMNIIWDKLNELKPKYWLHMEDDWLFFKPCDYVTKSIQFLEKYKRENIHQILFNKNYSETIEDYDLVGGNKLEDGDYILHIKDEEGIVGKNCSYWPHYSFRPSVCIVDTILNLGNFNSENKFFERDYADKYYEKGFKSAFYNEIVCIHTGRLTSERYSNKKNAYILNGESQFSNNIHYIYLSDYSESKIEHNSTIIKRVNNDNIKLTSYFKKLFINNNFNGNKAILCKLITYYNILKKIVLDQINADYFVIMEYDLYNEDFNKNIINIITKFKDDIIFLKNNNNNIYNSYIISREAVIKVLSHIDSYGFINKDLNEIYNIYNLSRNIYDGILVQYNHEKVFYEEDDSSSFDFNKNEKIKNEYIFIKGCDHYGDDIYHKSDISINDMIYISDNDENVVAFNTLGYFKNIINMKSLIKLNDEDGMFIHVDRYYKKYSEKLIE